MAYVTPHPGESFVVDYLPKDFKAWFPFKDDGVDLLLTRPKLRRAAPISVQVKWSRPYSDSRIPMSWYTLKKDRIRGSKADVWIFVVIGLNKTAASFEPHFVIVPITELRRRMPRSGGRIWHVYFHIFGKHRCYNTRGLNELDYELAETGKLRGKRDFSRFLENWGIL